jgi:hypothetical protein
MSKRIRKQPVVKQLANDCFNDLTIEQEREILALRSDGMSIPIIMKRFPLKRTLHQWTKWFKENKIVVDCRRMTIEERQYLAEEKRIEAARQQALLDSLKPSRSEFEQRLAAYMQDLED